MKKAFILLLLAACAPAGVELMGHTFTFQHTDTTYELSVVKNGAPATGLNIQGQIMNMEQKDIYYALAEETSPGKYTFTWMPSPGNYYVQFVFRADNTTLKPTFPINIPDREQVESDEVAVHWHSRINITLCGEPYYLPLEAGDLNLQHTHAEKDKLHLHAMVENENDDRLRLGDLFEQLKIQFNATCFAEYCNNDPCPDGNAGRLSMIVNNEEKNEFENYKWKDGDYINITFGGTKII